MIISIYQTPVIVFDPLFDNHIIKLDETDDARMAMIYFFFSDFSDSYSLRHSFRGIFKTVPRIGIFLGI
jgi:hypothetical protein